MMRFLISLTAVFAFAGCGGAPDAGNAAPKQASTNASAPTVVSNASPPEAKAAKLSEKFGGLLFTPAEIDAFGEVAKEAGVALDRSQLKEVDHGNLGR